MTRLHPRLDARKRSDLGLRSRANTEMVCQGTPNAWRSLCFKVHIQTKNDNFFQIHICTKNALEADYPPWYGSCGAPCFSVAGRDVVEGVPFLMA